MKGQNDKKSVIKKIAISAGAVLAAVLLFFAGYFTYYFTLDGGLRSLLWVKDKIRDEYYEEIDDDDFWQAAIDGVVGSLLDQYSEFYTAEEFDEVMNADQGIKSGVGASFFTGTNKVYHIAYNSPLFYASGNETREEGDSGIAVEEGMYLTGIGTGGQVEDTFTYAALAAKAALLSGDDPVTLRFSSLAADDTEHCAVVTVTPAVYIESYVLYAANGRAWAYVSEDGETYVWKDVSGYTPVEEKVPAGAAYLHLTQFYGNAGAEFAQAAAQYKEDGASVLLLDLRNNGGGSLAVMQQLCSYLCKDAPDGAVVLEARYRGGKSEKYGIREEYYADFFAGSTVYAAANGNSASASEALLGAMISYNTLGYGNIFITDTTGGQYDASTYGKGIMQTTFRNGGTGEAIKMTTAEIFWPNGTSIHGRGIRVSDGAAAVQAASYGEYGDPELSEIFSRIAGAA